MSRPLGCGRRLDRLAATFNAAIHRLALLNLPLLDRVFTMLYFSALIIVVYKIFSNNISVPRWPSAAARTWPPGLAVAGLCARLPPGRASAHCFAARPAGPPLSLIFFDEKKSPCDVSVALAPVSVYHARIRGLGQSIIQDVFWPSGKKM